jgi:hypothetical protein
MLPKAGPTHPSGSAPWCCTAAAALRHSGCLISDPPGLPGVPGGVPPRTPGYPPGCPPGYPGAAYVAFAAGGRRSRGSRHLRRASPSPMPSTSTATAPRANAPQRLGTVVLHRGFCIAAQPETQGRHRASPPSPQSQSVYGGPRRVKACPERPLSQRRAPAKPNADTLPRSVSNCCSS